MVRGLLLLALVACLGCSSTGEPRFEREDLRSLVQTAAQAYLATQGDLSSPESQAAAAEIVIGQVFESPAFASLVAMVIRKDPALQDPAVIAALVDQVLAELEAVGVEQ